MSATGVAALASAIGVPAKPAADDPSGAVVLSGTSGSGTLHFIGATWDATTPEPAVGAGPATPGTVWLTYTPSGPGQFTFSVAQTSCVVEILGAELVSVDSYDTGSGGASNPSITVSASTSQFYIRVHEYTAGASDSGWSNVAYTWSYSARTESLQLQGSGGVTAVDITPAGLRVDVGNGDPSAVVDFRVDGGSILLSAQLDELGTITAVSVPLPALSAGSHTLSATQQTGSKSASMTFTVTLDPYSYPAAISSDVAPVAVTQSGVVKWVFQDPAPGGEQYIFGINPNKMGSPHVELNVTAETTTAPNGQPLTWQGAPRAVPWEISGHFTALAQLQAFERFLALNRRVYLIDHYSRAWVVTVEEFDPQPVRAAGIPYAHAFSVRLLIYSGPVQL